LPERRTLGRTAADRRRLHLRGDQPLAAEPVLRLPLVAERGRPGAERAALDVHRRRRAGTVLLRAARAGDGGRHHGLRRQLADRRPGLRRPRPRAARTVRMTPARREALGASALAFAAMTTTPTSAAAQSAQPAGPAAPTPAMTRPLSRFIAGAQGLAIDEETLDLGRRHILDTLASAVACRDLE